MNLLDEHGAHLSGIEHLRAMMAADWQGGMARTLGIRLVEVNEGRIVTEATPGTEHYNPAGIVHGGFAAALLDTSCGYAVLSRMQPGQNFMTLELKVAYHRAMTSDTGPVRAEAWTVTCGRRVAFAEGRLTDADGRLYATATSSLLVMSGPS
ncbi:MAG TPA: PaaI family thioesterase [Longimicrobium sp.]|uniref:PaaI family thioesterase n=1 Tax=Longimicrobium sp. TaxID=2029185 RepID=UPI002ED9C0ED